MPVGCISWHDYPMANELQVAKDWRGAIAQINEKYDYLWRRFAESVKEEGEKIFVLSTTQYNLSEFAADEAEFQKTFALDGQFIANVGDALREIGTSNYSMLAMVRSFAETDALRKIATGNQLTIRYCGLLSLPTHDLVAQSFEGPSSRQDNRSLDVLQGIYRNGAKIERQSDDAVRAFRREQGEWVPWAEGYSWKGGYIFAFEGRDRLFFARFENGHLRFSNNTAWAKA